MNCCNANGECTQGRDCPIRKQRAKETNDAYIERGRWGSVSDPYDDVTQTFKALLAVIAVVSIAGLVFWAWVK